MIPNPDSSYQRSLTVWGTLPGKSRRKNLEDFRYLGGLDNQAGTREVLA